MSEKTESALTELLDIANWEFEQEDQQWYYEGMGNPKKAAAELAELTEKDKRLTESILALRGEMVLAKQMWKETIDQNAQLRAELDKCIAWHEGDCSPHAQLEQTIAELRVALKDAVSLAQEATDQGDLGAKAWLKRHAHLLEEPK